MARKRSRKVLYEVTSRIPEDKGAASVLEKTRKRRAFVKKEQQKSDAGHLSGRTLYNSSRGRLLRKIVFLLPKRFSMPKAVTVVVVIALLVWFSGLFRSPENSPQPSGSRVETGLEGKEAANRTISESQPNNEFKAPTRPENEVTGPPKDHIIVIASHKGDVQQLKPVGEYFAENGIANEIRQSGQYYTLVTSERFSASKYSSSRLNEVKNEIINIGADYKAPKGFLSFTFKTVYDKRIKK